MSLILLTYQEKLEWILNNEKHPKFQHKIDKIVESTFKSRIHRKSRKNFLQLHIHMNNIISDSCH